GRARGVVAGTAVAEAPRPAGFRFSRAARRYGWTVAVYALLALLMVITIAIKPDYGSFEWNTLTLAALPLAFAAVAQTIVVLSGGLGLSVGPLLALANVLALRALLVLLVIPLVWIPLRRSRAGLAIYAVGSDRNAAFRSGVNLGWSRLLAYAVCGFFAACGGLALSMTTGVGTPLAGTYYTLSGVSAIVLGGVSLAGGRGGMLGPVA